MTECRFKRNRKGAILVVTALMSTLIIGITALVVDVGYLYYVKNDLQTAVNAAWLAGNDRLMKLKTQSPTLSQEDKDNIKEHVLEVFKENGFEMGENDSRIDFQIENDRDLYLGAQIHSGLFFAKLITTESTMVSANRDEPLFAHLKSHDILPIVMPHGIVKWDADKRLSFQAFAKGAGFTLGNEYIIKPGQISDNSILCQGITDYSLEGSTDVAKYERNLNYGFTRALSIGDQIGLACVGFPTETKACIQKRLGKNDENRVIIPLVEVTEEIAKSYGVSPDELSIYNLRSQELTTEGNKVSKAAKIVGFAEFEIIPTSSYTRTDNNYQNGDAGTLGSATSGQVRGLFLGYLVNPNDKI